MKALCLLAAEMGGNQGLPARSVIVLGLTKGRLLTCGRGE